MNSISDARKYIDPLEIQVVCYHGNCKDGTCAAWIAYRNLPKSTLFLPIIHGKVIPNIESTLVGKNVLFVDCKPEETYFDLPNTKILVLDHHQTAQRKLKSRTDCYFDMNMSGALLAWNYFYPGVDVPEFVTFIHERDLKLNQSTRSKLFCASFYKTRHEFKLFEECMNPSVVERYIKKGEKEIKHVECVIKESEDQSIEIVFEGFKCRLLRTEKHVSDIAEHLLEKFDVDVVAFFYVDNMTNRNKVSLRSKNDGADVACIAEKYGGGGHQASASFLTDISYDTFVFNK